MQLMLSIRVDGNVHVYIVVVNTSVRHVPRFPRTLGRDPEVAEEQRPEPSGVIRASIPNQ